MVERQSSGNQKYAKQASFSQGLGGLNPGDFGDKFLITEVNVGGMD